MNKNIEYLCTSEKTNLLLLTIKTGSDLDTYLCSIFRVIRYVNLILTYLLALLNIYPSHFKWQLKNLNASFDQIRILVATTQRNNVPKFINVIINCFLQTENLLFHCNGLRVEQLLHWNEAPICATMINFITYSNVVK